VSTPEGGTPAGGRGAGDGDLGPGGEPPVGRPATEGLVGEGVEHAPVAQPFTREGRGIHRVPEPPEVRALPPA
jgi:hypothetical protein